jgi:hypothetical protein
MDAPDWAALLKFVDDYGHGGVKVMSADPDKNEEEYEIVNTEFDAATETFYLLVW